MIAISPPFISGELDLLRAINGCHSPYWDAAMWAISHFAAWVFPSIALLFFVFWRRPKSEAVLLLLCIGLCVAIGDVLSSHIAKPFFERLRPTHTPELQDSLHYVYGYHGKLYGFFSGHTANYTAVATLLCLTFRNRAFTGAVSLLVGWVIYSRIYIGAHFPSDCLMGLAVGLTIGWLVYKLYSYLRQQFLATRYKTTPELYREGIGYLALSLILSIPITLAFALEITRLMR